MPTDDRPADDLLVACLCAGWCLTCGAYRDTFDAVARAHHDVRWAWIDIEDHADALESGGAEAPDITNFPTLLLVQGGTPRFFGTVLPHANVLDRLLQQARAGALPALADPQVTALARAAAALAHSG